MTPDPTTTAARADAMTEEPPRDLANLVADALDVVTVSQRNPDRTGTGTDWNLAILARQVAELAQHVARLDATPADPVRSSLCADLGFGTITLPLDANGEPFAWPDGAGGWMDAWRGIYTDAAHLRAEVPHWTASPHTRTLAYGVTTWETDQ